MSSFREARAAGDRAIVYRDRPADPTVLLHPNVPMPMAGVNPRTVMGDEWWQAQRKAAAAAQGECCLACGTHRMNLEKPWLEGHETYAIDYTRGRMVFERVVMLCHDCHQFIHSGRLKALMDKGEIPTTTFDYLMERGLRLLGDYVGAWNRRHDHSGPEARWADWRLVFEGREYPPFHKTYEDWCVAYNHPLPNTPRARVLRAVREADALLLEPGFDEGEDWGPF